MVCPRCRCLIDDHKQGQCKDTGAAFITIQVTGRFGLIPVNMPAVTTLRYAAMRAAEALGLNPEGSYCLYDPVAQVFLKEAESVALYDNRVLKLAWIEKPTD